LQLPAEVVPFDVFHRQIGDAVADARTEHFDNMGMVKRGERLAFPLEALAELVLLGEVGGQDFKGDGLAVGLTFVDLAHTTFANHIQDIVSAQFAPRKPARMGDSGKFLSSIKLVQIEVEAEDAAVYEPLHPFARGVEYQSDEYGGQHRCDH